MTTERVEIAARVERTRVEYERLGRARDQAQDEWRAADLARTAAQEAFDCGRTKKSEAAMRSAELRFDSTERVRDRAVAAHGQAGKVLADAQRELALCDCYIARDRANGWLASIEPLLARLLQLDAEACDLLAHMLSDTSVSVEDFRAKCLTPAHRLGVLTEVGASVATPPSIDALKKIVRVRLRDARAADQRPDVSAEWLASFPSDWRVQDLSVAELARRERAASTNGSPGEGRFSGMRDLGPSLPATPTDEVSGAALARLGQSLRDAPVSAGGGGDDA